MIVQKVQDKSHYRVGVFDEQLQSLTVLLYHIRSGQRRCHPQNIIL